MHKINTLAGLLRQRAIPFVCDEPLALHTSFRIGGPADLFAEPRSKEELADAITCARQAGVRYMLLGKGSNVLFHDEGYRGLVIHLGDGLSTVRVEGNILCAGAGADLAAVCIAAREAGLAGLEFAYGIPGSVGGAVYMNAGAYGGEMRDVLQSVCYLDGGGKQHSIPASDLSLGYRQSVFQQKDWCILEATIRLLPGEPAAIDARMTDYMQRRRDKQPLEYPSAGSAFKRPPGAFAGALIDQCGLRGCRVGGAAVSDKHCGFIVNLDNATCADVMALADHVVQTVETQTGYKLEKEVRVVAPG